MIKSFIEFLKEKYIVLPSHKLDDNKVEIFFKGTPNKLPCFTEEFVLKDTFTESKNFSLNLSELKKIIPETLALRFFILFDIRKKLFYIVSWPAQVIHKTFFENLKNPKNVDALKIPRISDYYQLYLKNNFSSKVVKEDAYILFAGEYDKKFFSSSEGISAMNDVLKSLNLADIYNVLDTTSIGSSWDK